MSDLKRVEKDVGTRVANYVRNEYGGNLKIIPHDTSTDGNGPTGELGTWYTWEVDGEPVYMLDYFSGGESHSDGATHYVQGRILKEMESEE
jgi:hypothetical protein